MTALYSSDEQLLTIRQGYRLLVHTGTTDYKNLFGIGREGKGLIKAARRLRTGVSHFRLT